MNGIHDMGGMQAMGPLVRAKDEPVFDAAWEGRVFALNRVASAGGKWNIDASRYEIEIIPPAEYLRMSYYERWYTRLVELLVKRGIVTPEEIESGRPAANVVKAIPVISAGNLSSVFAPADPERQKATAMAHFSVGQSVRAKNVHPVHHTRLPRYARGKRGTIERNHGIFVFPDTNAHVGGEHPQHVYSVRFTARELWGSQAAPQDSVYMDLWDDYLEPV